jgi:hypothetical protein
MAFKKSGHSLPGFGQFANNFNIFSVAFEAEAIDARLKLY